jgi:hypothetical protein
VLLGNGDGSFRSRRDFLVASANWVALGDLNDDDNLDLAVAGDDRALVLLGDGNGQFVTHSSFPTNNSICIAVGDLDGDRVLGETQGLGRVYSLVLSYERGEWDRLSRLVQDLGVSTTRILEIYGEAIEWTDRIFEITGK